MEKKASHVSKEILDTIRRKTRGLFSDSRGSHDWEHTLRVYRLCEHIGEAEGADMEVLLSAAYLHDIGRCYQDATNGAVCHARKGAEMAPQVLAGVQLTDKQVDHIVQCIRTHRFRDDSVPQSLEAKILFDADKLDAIGAVGVARAYLFAGEVGARLHTSAVGIENSQPYSRDDTGYREFRVKLCKIKDRMMTSEGRKLAEERHRFMEAFFDRFLEEYEGNV